MRSLLPALSSSLGARCRRVGGAAAVATTTIAVTIATLAVTSPARADLEDRATNQPADSRRAVAAANPVTPGNFRGYGFDQCLTPTQSAMDKWLHNSPFLAVGVYISGDSRACRSQPNLTATWVRTQLSRGWKILPITLGPQASCQPRFPRYSDDYKINPSRTNNYKAADLMGVREADKAVAAARALGISPGSTLWYDLEGFDHTDRDCRESALQFISGWSYRLRQLRYVSGVYSSAGSGMAALDGARVSRPTRFVLPDMVWLARWDGVANTSTSYMREDGWRPGRRVKQYRGGHDEVWGGQRINIDSNYLDLGRGSIAAPESHCGGVTVDFASYPGFIPGRTAAAAQVKALQCLLQEQGTYRGALHGRYDQATINAVRAWQARVRMAPNNRWMKRHWVRLFTGGAQPVLKIGSAGGYVRRIQRALNVRGGTGLRITGVYDAATASAVRGLQQRWKAPVSGIVNSPTWRLFAAGRR